MSEYHLVYTNLKSGVRLGELPVVSFSMEEAYNASGSLSADLLLEDTYTVEYATGPTTYTTLTTPQGVTLTSLVPGATGIYMERNGVVMWGGVLWAMDMDVEGSTCSISAEGFMSYLDRIHINTDLTWTATDQGVIAKELLEAAMAKPGADIGLTAPTPTVSTSRDRAYPALERKHFGEAIRQLADVEGGFSWRFEHAWNVDADGVDTYMALDTSDAGRLTNYVFELGVNISLLSLSIDGTNVANYAEAWAQGEGDTGWYRFAYNSAALLTYPLLEVIEDFSDVKASDTLQGKADQALSRGAAPIKRAAIEVYSDSLPTLGSYEVGERITLKGSYGGIELAGLWRILEMKLDVSGNGEEKIELGLVPQGVFG